MRKGRICITSTYAVVGLAFLMMRIVLIEREKRNIRGVDSFIADESTGKWRIWKSTKRPM